MRKIDIILGAVLSAAATLLATTAHASEGNLVSSELINKQGYSLKIGDGIKAKLVNVTNQMKPEKDCLVNVDSLEKMDFSKYKWQRSGEGAGVKFEMQARINGGVIYCDGGGTGCRVTMSIGSVSEEARIYLGIR